MSNMLEEAIADAKTLREAAIRNAEHALVKKYSDEVKAGVERLLEAEGDEDLLGGDGEDMFDGEDLASPEADESSAIGQVPLAHMDNDDEESVMINLDDIVAAGDPTPEEDASLGREEIADEVGISLDDDPSPANRDDDTTIDDDDQIDISESDLLDIFKEMLTVDLPQKEIAQ